MKEHLKDEAKRHMERMYHEKEMHEKSTRGLYKNEEDRPSIPAHGHQMEGCGVNDMKGDAMSIAYGQASVSGMKSDEKKINAQFKDYGWDGGASNY